jgi:hypothetical protein
MVATLSPAQEQMWFLDQLDPGDAAFRMWVAERLTGPVDEPALEAAVNGVVARHESLRTRFPVVDGRPALEVLPRLAIPLERVDLSGEADPEAAARARRSTRGCPPRSTSPPTRWSG